MRYWVFASRKSKMPQTFQLFVDSGIYQMLNKAIAVAKVTAEHQVVKRSKDWNLFTAVKLNGSIQTIFIITAVAWGVCLVAFVIEVRDLVEKRVRLFGHWFWIHVLWILFWVQEKAVICHGNV